MRAAFKNQQRGAILTTHYMEEAEAVCDRVAIMVSGQLRCVLLSDLSDTTDVVPSRSVCLCPPDASAPSSI